MSEAVSTRPLTIHERRLAQWMLEHGGPAAGEFLSQLARAEATTWRCVCGCASFNFKVSGEPEAPRGVHIVGDFVVGEGENSFGVFIFESGGILSGVELYALGQDAPSVLPEPDQLRSLEAVSVTPTPPVPRDNSSCP